MLLHICLCFCFDQYKYINKQLKKKITPKNIKKYYIYVHQNTFQTKNKKHQSEHINTHPLLTL
jgi:hypothetical protein